MSDFRGLLLVLFLAVIAGYWVMLAEHVGCQPGDAADRPAPKRKATPKKRTKKGTK